MIEDQFIGPRNPGSALKVAKSAAWLIGYWRGLGHEGPTKWVPPSTWKRKLCGGPAPKQKSMRLCDYRVHETVLASLCDEEVCVYWHAMYACGLNREARLDVCDAVGIGLWYLISSGRRGILS